MNAYHIDENATLFDVHNRLNLSCIVNLNSLDEEQREYCFGRKNYLHIRISKNIIWASEPVRMSTCGRIERDYISTEYNNVALWCFEQTIKLEFRQLLHQYGFYLENSEEILTYIKKNIEILDCLKEAKYHASKYFPTNELVLDYYYDSEDNFETLSIKILHNLSSELAFEREQQLFINWFEPYYTKYNGKIILRAYSH